MIHRGPDGNAVRLHLDKPAASNKFLAALIQPGQDGPR